MKISKIYPVHIIAVLLTVSNLTYSQQEVLPVTDAEKGSPHSLYAGTGFGSNMVYMGTSISQDKPYFYGSLTYGFKDKLFVSASGFHLNAFDQALAFSTLGTNYSQVVNSWFDISVGLSGYLVNKNLVDTLFTNFLYGDLALGFDWKILYTKVSVGGLFAESSGVYFQMRNSHFFQTPELLNGKAYVSFDPYVNMLFGSMTETKTADGTTIGITPPYHTKKSGGGSSTTTIFGLTEIDLGIPIAFNTNRFTFEAEPGFAIPLYSDTDPLNPKGFVFLLSCFIKIF